MSKNKIELQDTYAYGFHDQDVSVYRTRKGLDAQVVETISRIKQEPDWMRELRLKAYDSFVKQKNPDWGPDLSGIDFDEYTYYWCIFHFIHIWLITLYFRKCACYIQYSYNYYKLIK